MYLFLFDDGTYYIVNGWNFCEALSKCYEYLGCNNLIATELFEKMMRPLSFEESVSILNSMSYIKITDVYHKLEPLYQTAKEEIND